MSKSGIVISNYFFELANPSPIDGVQTYVLQNGDYSGAIVLEHYIKYNRLDAHLNTGSHALDKWIRDTVPDPDEMEESEEELIKEYFDKPIWHPIVRGIQNIFPNCQVTSN
jgi:hypothetical protein